MVERFIIFAIAVVAMTLAFYFLPRDRQRYNKMSAFTLLTLIFVICLCLGVIMRLFGAGSGTTFGLCFGGVFGAGFVRLLHQRD